MADGILNIAYTSTLDNAKISAIRVVNDLETSENETSLNNSISVYPNPATDKLFYNSADKPFDKIQLFDLSGKIVYTDNLQLHHGSIDLSGISSGLYIVKVHLGDNIYTNKLSIKQ